MVFPSREEFTELSAQQRPIPVYRNILADIETPLSAYWKLSHDETYSFLLESVTGGENLARYSVLGARPKSVLRTKGKSVRKVTRAGEQRSELQENEDPLDVLKACMEPVRPIELDGMPRFFGGAVGMMGYDLVRFFENLPDEKPDPLGVDDLAMMLTESVVIFDHATNQMRIVVLAEPTSDGYESALAEIERVCAKLRRPIPDLPSSRGEMGEVSSDHEPGEFEDSVRAAKEAIGAGEGIQFVLSQRFSVPSSAHPITLYRALRPLNPSPYMFLMRFGDFDLVGASPELLVSLTGNVARVRPIAGTRPRGKTPERDAELAEELLADEKERAEHLMLVDLGRNDLGRVCRYGSVRVREFMVIERYSHVMHIVSDVVGALNLDLDAMDLIRATFPAGTVSGAPKVRAMEIIEEREKSKRGAYAGCVGFLAANGDFDAAIAIRTIVLKNGMAHVQAGAGIVWDSIPENEELETRNKARAALLAVQRANCGGLDAL